jgi:hypothetical protein
VGLDALRAYDEDGARCEGDDRLRYRAEQQPSNAAAAVSADHEEIGLQVGGELRDARGGFVYSQVRDDAALERSVSFHVEREAIVDRFLQPRRGVVEYVATHARRERGRERIRRQRRGGHDVDDVHFGFGMP